LVVPFFIGNRPLLSPTHSDAVRVRRRWECCEIVYSKRRSAPGSLSRYPRRSNERDHHDQPGHRIEESFDDARYHRAPSGRVAGLENHRAAKDRDDQQNDESGEREKYPETYHLDAPANWRPSAALPQSPYAAGAAKRT